MIDDLRWLKSNDRGVAPRLQVLVDDAVWYDVLEVPPLKEEKVYWCDHYRYEEKCASAWLAISFTDGKTRTTPSDAGFMFKECPYCGALKP